MQSITPRLEAEPTCLPPGLNRQRSAHPHPVQAGRPRLQGSEASSSDGTFLMKSSTSWRSADQHSAVSSEQIIPRPQTNKTQTKTNPSSTHPQSSRLLISPSRCRVSGAYTRTGRRAKKSRWVGCRDPRPQSPPAFSRKKGTLRKKTWAG